MTQAYGPFADEQLFHFTDKTILILEQFQIYDSSINEFIGFDDLQVIYDRGKKANFQRIFFTGIGVIEDPKILCQRGFDLLFEAALTRRPALTPAGFERRCKDCEIRVEIICQLKNMPVAYLTESPANSILVYSNNYNNFNRQRCYIANTFHIECFSRSEQTLQFAMVEKFVLQTTKKFKKTLREDRDVHWLVDHYITAYNKVFHHHQRPTLHRAAVYDFFAVYSDLLGNVFSHKLFPINVMKWRVWVAEAKEYREKAEADGSNWGTVPLGRLKEFPEKEQEEVENGPIGRNMMDLDIPDAFQDPLNENESNFTPESSSSEEDVPYTMDPALAGLMQRRLLKRMPLPEWFWECDIDPDCPFVINLNRAHRTAEAPYMVKLSEEEKKYLLESSWRLLDKKVQRIWKKICQSHWEEHMEQVGLLVDHVHKRIVKKDENEI